MTRQREVERVKRTAPRTRNAYEKKCACYRDEGKCILYEEHARLNCTRVASRFAALLLAIAWEWKSFEVDSVSRSQMGLRTRRVMGISRVEKPDSTSIPRKDIPPSKSPRLIHAPPYATRSRTSEHLVVVVFGQASKDPESLSCRLSQPRSPAITAIRKVSHDRTSMSNSQLES